MPGGAEPGRNAFSAGLWSKGYQIERYKHFGKYNLI
jgi:hypothetical protein